MVRLGEFRTWVVGMAAVLAACSAAAGLAPMTAQTDELRKVLILNSYHAGYKGSDDLVDGIRASLAESGKRVVVKVEYLDSKEFPEEEHRKRMLDALRAKYRKHPYDLLVTPTTMPSTSSRASAMPSSARCRWCFAAQTISIAPGLPDTRISWVSTRVPVLPIP